MNKPRIVVVEDEAKIANLLRDYLTRENFEVTLAFEGSGAVELVRTLNPVLVVLDLMLPGVGGLDICREIRSYSSVPVIMLTARVDEQDRLDGFRVGADDYVCKPFSPSELVARVHSVLRRSNNSDQYNEPEDLIDYRGLVLNTSQLSCCVNDTPVSLTRIEFRMLHGMLLKPGKVFSRYQLMRMAYDDHRVVSDRTIDSHVSHLRRKLGPGLNDGEILHSTYGVGYRVE